MSKADEIEELKKLLSKNNIEIIECKLETAINILYDFEDAIVFKVKDNLNNKEKELTFNTMYLNQIERLSNSIAYHLRAKE